MQLYTLSVIMNPYNSITRNNKERVVETAILSKEAMKTKEKIPRKIQHCLHPRY